MDIWKCPKKQGKKQGNPKVNVHSLARINKARMILNNKNMQTQTKRKEKSHHKSQKTGITKYKEKSHPKSRKTGITKHEEKSHHKSRKTSITKHKEKIHHRSKYVSMNDIIHV